MSLLGSAGSTAALCVNHLVFKKCDLTVCQQNSWISSKCFGVGVQHEAGVFWGGSMRQACFGGQCVAGVL